MGSDGHFDYDWIIIGSGFGGSVSALRLAEKGHRVAVLECGARFEDHDFAEQTSDAKRYYWMPYLGLKGILKTDALQGHLRWLGMRCRRWRPRIRKHALPTAARFLR